ncbi:MAG: HD domain-containing protein [Calditrichaeota bacterium]|nr:MAG: HD domain-containing protein [Calditrichota bacterium]
MLELFEYIRKNRARSVSYVLGALLTALLVITIIQLSVSAMPRLLFFVGLSLAAGLVFAFYLIKETRLPFRHNVAQGALITQTVLLLSAYLMAGNVHLLFAAALLFVVAGQRFLLGSRAGLISNALVLTLLVLSLAVQNIVMPGSVNVNYAAFFVIGALLIDGVSAFSLSVIAHLQRQQKELEVKQENLRAAYKKIRRELYLNNQMVTSLHKDVQRKNIEIKNILTMSGQLSESSDTQKALESFLLTIMGQIGAEHALILTQARPEQKYFGVQAARGIRGIDMRKIRFYLNSALMDYIDSALEPFPVESIPRTNLFADEIKLLKLFEKDIFCPILIKGHLSGLMIVGKKVTGKMFTPEDLNLISIVANQAAFVMEQSQLSNEFQDIYFKTIKAMMKALEAKYVFARGHNTRTATYVSKVASKMGLPAHEVKDLTYGTLLHDVGKIAIRDKYLLDPKVFREDENIVKQKILEHTIKGAAILRSAGFDEKIVELALHHHESFDGKGYPHKIGGREISTGVRILSVCNTYDAMTSDRPHRKALSRLTAREYLEYNAGKRFDSDVVSAFLSHLDETRNIQKFN